MKSTIQAPKSREELDEELTALKLKIALQEYQAESLETILADEPGDSSAREQLARSEKPTIRRLNRRLRRRSLRRFAVRTLPKAGRAAACLILVFYIGLTVAVATVQSVRVDLMRFFVRIDGGQASFGFETSDDHLDVPSGWNGYYYPSYIPDGYVLTGVFDDSVVYQNPAGTPLPVCDRGPDPRWPVDDDRVERRQPLPDRGLRGHKGRGDDYRPKRRHGPQIALAFAPPPGERFFSKGSRKNFSKKCCSRPGRVDFLYGSSPYGEKRSMPMRG